MEIRVHAHIIHTLHTHTQMYIYTHIHMQPLAGRLDRPLHTSAETTAQANAAVPLQVCIYSVHMYIQQLRLCAAKFCDAQVLICVYSCMYASAETTAHANAAVPLQVHMCMRMHACMCIYIGSDFAPVYVAVRRYVCACVRVCMYTSAETSAQAITTVSVHAHIYRHS
jgi:hypothetical protein